jgi:hypothetical protein
MAVIDVLDHRKHVISPIFAQKRIVDMQFCGCPRFPKGACPKPLTSPHAPADNKRNLVLQGRRLPCVQPADRQLMKQKTREIKSGLRKAYPDKTEEELDRLTQEASDGAEWYKSLTKGNKAKNRLRAEYPNLSQEQAEELAKKSHEEWFQGLGKRLADDNLKTHLDAPFVAAEAGGRPKNETPATAQNHFGAIAEEDFDDPGVELQAKDRSESIKLVEWTTGLLLSTGKRELQCLYVSIAMGLLKNDLDIKEMAEYHKKTPRRVEQLQGEHTTQTQSKPSRA